MRTLNTISNNDWFWPRRSLSSDLFDQFFSDIRPASDGLALPHSTAPAIFQPSCDIRETSDHYLVSFDMPGVKKEDVQVEMNDQQLVISGERRFESQNSESEQILKHERAYGKFQRSFTLPVTVDSGKIEAHYEDGVLNVAIPKSEAAKPRSIQVQTGKSNIFSKLLGTNIKDAKVS